MPAVVFDVVGTCFSYARGAEVVEERLGAKLKEYGVSSKLFFYSWIASTERDYGYLSQLKKYATFEAIMKSTFYRQLWMAGVPEPYKLASEEDLAAIWQGHCSLKPNPGMEQMMSTLRSNGFEVWCCTDASPERVYGYFKNAGVDMPMDHIISADSVAAGKPEPEVYKKALATTGVPAEQSVFAAAHAWDIAAAKSAGFNTAYCLVYEKYECDDIFGKADLVAEGLAELADKIVAQYGHFAKK